MMRSILLVFCLSAASTASAQQQLGGAASNAGTRVGSSGFGGNPSLGGGAGQSLAEGGIDAGAGGASSINRTFTGDFIGGGDTATRFVGNEAAGTQTGQTRGPNFAGLRGAIQSADTATPPRSPVRAQLRIGFEVPQVSRPNVAPLAVDPLTTALRVVDPSLRVTMRDGDAALSGRVGSDHERKLAEALLRLQPGVRRVVSNVTVGPDASVAPQTLPLPAASDVTID